MSPFGKFRKKTETVFKKAETGHVSGIIHHRSVTALITAPLVTLQVLDDLKPVLGREALLRDYLAALLSDLDLEHSLAVGAAAMDVTVPGAGDVLKLWHKTRTDTTSPQPSLNALIAQCARPGAGESLTDQARWIRHSMKAIYAEENGA